MSIKTPWDDRYATDEYVYGTRANDFLVEMTPQMPVGTTLCVAEGEGRNAVWLAEQGHKVVAVDASVVGLRKAQVLAKQRGVNLITEVADLGNYSLQPESYDLIVSIFAHATQEVRVGLHRNIVNALRPGGFFLLEAYTPKQLGYNTGGPPDIEKLMTLDALREELSGLDFVHALETEREVVEGKLHTGKGSVVQVLAKKPFPA
mgnify:CR=1 FL=1